jgi:hypothetical protein
MAFDRVCPCYRANREDGLGSRQQKTARFDRRAIAQATHTRPVRLGHERHLMSAFGMGNGGCERRDWAQSGQKKFPPMRRWRAQKSEKTAAGCLAAVYKAKSERQGNVALVPVRAAFWIKDRP